MLFELTVMVPLLSAMSDDGGSCHMDDRKRRRIPHVPVCAGRVSYSGAWLG